MSAMPHVPKFSAAVCLLAFAPLLAQAQTTSSPDPLLTLMKQREFGQVDRQARDRLRANANDEQAYNFVALAALSSDETMREDAIPVLKACTDKLTRSSICHHRLGQLYGVAAMSGGMMSAMKYGGKIKDLFAKAVELDPRNFEARRDLMQFYLQAPGLVGGSVAKAQEQAEAHGKSNALQGKLLELDVKLYKKEWDAAEQIVSQWKATDDDSRSALRSATGSLGFSLLNANQPERARKWFERAVTASPDHAPSHFGLGRALLDAKQVDAAIASLERATQIDPAIGAQYRLGIAYQLKGDKPKAIANLEKFLDVKPARVGKAADDARQRLEILRRPA